MAPRKTTDNKVKTPKYIQVDYEQLVNKKKKRKKHVGKEEDASQSS